MIHWQESKILILNHIDYKKGIYLAETKKTYSKNFCMINSKLKSIKRINKKMKNVLGPPTFLAINQNYDFLPTEPDLRFWYQAYLPFKVKINRIL